MFGPSRFFFPVLWPLLTSCSSLLLRIFFRIRLLKCVCKTSPGTHTFFPSLPAAFTESGSVQLSGFVLHCKLTPASGLICGFCSSGQSFALWETFQLPKSGFLQIPPHDGHPCLWLYLPTAGWFRDFHPIERALTGRTMGTALRFCSRRPAELLFVGDVLRDVLQAAVQRRTQFVQRLCFHVVIGPQTPDGLTVDAALLPKLVGGNTFFLHHIPQLIKNNHDLTR